VNWLVEANVSEKRTVSIFRAEVTMLGISLASTSQYTRRPNSEEHHQYINKSFPSLFKYDFSNTLVIKQGNV
jgi:hypothetical protein